MRNRHASAHTQALRLAPNKSFSGWWHCFTLRHSWRVRQIAGLRLTTCSKMAAQRDREGDSKAAPALRRIRLLVLLVPSKRSGASEVHAQTRRAAVHVRASKSALVCFMWHQSAFMAQAGNTCKAHELQREGAMDMRSCIHVVHTLWSEPTTPIQLLCTTSLVVVHAL